MNPDRRHRRWATVVVVAGAAATALAISRLARVEVTGHSMVPTLTPGERLLVVRGLPVHQGDLAAVRDPRVPSRLLVKRVMSAGRGPITVAGDNAPASTDSRQFGPVAPGAVVGRAVYRYWPPERAGWLTGDCQSRRRDTETCLSPLARGR